METNLGYFIDKDYLKNSFINYDKDFLFKKYYLKSDGEKIENSLEEFTKEANENINKLRFKKYYLESEEDLPNPNEADYNGIYIVLDSKSIDEKCNNFLYSVIEKEDGTKTWVVLSTPSYLFETENLDYDKEFEKYKRKSKLSGCLCFYNFNSLYTTIKNLTNQEQESGRYVWDFYRNSKYNFESVKISVTQSDAKYKSNDETGSEYIEVDDLNTFAQTIINNVNVGGE